MADQDSVTGADILLSVLETEGVTHIFGNPGTTELPLMDRLSRDDRFSYVLALQEASAVAMADGYSQRTHRPAFVNVHSMAGLGNAMGNLTNAIARRSPLVITAGQQDLRHLVTEPLLSGDLVGLAAGSVKLSVEVRTVAELGTVMRRAFRAATSAPCGPVFVSLPMNLLDETSTLGTSTVKLTPPRSRIRTSVVADGLDELVRKLLRYDASDIAIVAGDEVAQAGALLAMVDVAERLGCSVFGEPVRSATVFPTTHPQWAGGLVNTATALRRALEPYKLVFLVSADPFVVYHYTEGPAAPETTELVQLSSDALAIGRTHPVSLGLVGDPKITLEALAELLVEATCTREVQPVQPAEIAAAPHTGEILSAEALVATLYEALVDDIGVIDEAVTTGQALRSLQRTSRADSYFFCRGGGLGWAMPAAVGVGLAQRGEPLLCVVGDGAAMYSIQSLWTAAHEAVDVLFVVANNSGYEILKRNMRSRGADEAGGYLAMSIAAPNIDFVGLAASLGVPSKLASNEAEILEAIDAWKAVDGPFLMEVPIVSHQM